jgi:hypothetical protein
MREMRVCPAERPFWCAHPHCLFCNWDDDRDGHASTLAAHLGECDPRERHLDDFSERHHYVAWLCVECADDASIVRWFTDTVHAGYPDATIVEQPGLSE